MYLTQKTLPMMTLFDLRNASLFCIIYFTAARFEEAADLLTENIKVSPGGNLEIVFVKSKVNQFRNQRSAFLTPHEGTENLDPAKIIAHYANCLTRVGGSHFFFPLLTG